MTRRLPLTFLGLASPVLLVATLIDSPLAVPIFAVLAASFPLALVALGVAGDGPAARTSLAIKVGLVILLVFYEGCLLGVLALHGRDAPWLFGLPLATALQLFGILLAPLPAVGLLYAWTFDRHGVSRRDLEELRARFPRAEETE